MVKCGTAGLRSPDRYAGPVDWVYRSVLVPALVSLATALFYRWVDRPTVLWRTYNEGAWWHTNLASYHAQMPEASDGDCPQAKFLLANAGDSDAFDVRLTGHGCGLQIDPYGSEFGPGRQGGEQLDRQRPVVHPGRVEKVTVLCHPDDWAMAVVVASYTSRSWLRGARRSHLILPLADIARCPTLADRRGLNAPEGVIAADVVLTYPVRGPGGEPFSGPTVPLTSRRRRRRFIRDRLSSC